MHDNRPIGIFDSGVGGLSVALSIRKALPCEDLIYLADLLHAPYGNKSQDFIAARSSALVELLLSKNVKAIVIACNTVTVSAIALLRTKYAIPFIGVEPGVKPAVLSTKCGVVGVLATQRTIDSESFSNLVKRWTGSAKVVMQACPGLAEQVDKAELDNQATLALLKSYVDPLLAAGADTLVMGCTHYAFLTPLLRSVITDSVQIVNTHDAIAKEVVRRLRVEKLLHSQTTPGNELFLTSRGAEKSAQVFEKLWGKAIHLQNI